MLRRVAGWFKWWAVDAVYLASEVTHLVRQLPAYGVELVERLAGRVERAGREWDLLLSGLDTPAVCDECMAWDATELVDVPAGGLAEVCTYCADTLVANCGAKRVPVNG